MNYNYLIEFSNHYDRLKSDGVEMMCYAGTSYMSAKTNLMFFEIVFDGKNGDIINTNVVKKKEADVSKVDDFLWYGTESSLGRTSNNIPYMLEDKIKYYHRDDLRDILIKNIEVFYQITGVKEIKYVLNALKDGRIASLIKKQYPALNKSNKDVCISYVIQQKDGTEVYLRDNPVLAEKWEAYVLSDDYLPEEYYEYGFCQASGKKSVVSLNKNSIQLKLGPNSSRLICDNDNENGVLYKGERYKEMGYDSFHVSKNLMFKSHAAMQWYIRNRGFVSDNSVCFLWSNDNGQDLVDYMGYTGVSSNAVESYEKVKNFIWGRKQKLTDDSNIYLAEISSFGKGPCSFTAYEKFSESLMTAGLDNWYTVFGDFIGEKNNKTESKSKGKDEDKKKFRNDFSPYFIGGLLKEKTSKVKLSIIASVLRNQKVNDSIVNKLMNKALNNKDDFHFYTKYIVRLVQYNYLVESNNKQGEEEMRKISYDYLCGRLFAVMERLEANNVRNYALDKIGRFRQSPLGLWEEIFTCRHSVNIKNPRHYYYFMKIANEIISLIDENNYDITQSIKSHDWILGYNYQIKEGFKRKEKEKEVEELSVEKSN